MAIYDIYSKKQKRIRGEISDVYTYDHMPNKLKIQFLQIINNTIGDCSSHYVMKNHYYKEKYSDGLYRAACEILRSEYGTFNLYPGTTSYKDEIYKYFLGDQKIDNCLDIVDIFCNFIDGYVRKYQDKFIMDADGAINEINTRFKESNIGFQFESGEIVRVDSQFIHSEVVKPTLFLLSLESEYAGALNEFLSAHEHYRHGNYKECLNDCLKAFESLMKAIHDKHGWQYNKHDTASKLVNSCLSNELIPSYLQSQFTSLKTMLEAGVPTIRNKNSGHGQGSAVTVVPQELTSYMLHLTATNLLFLAKSEQALN